MVLGVASSASATTRATVVVRVRDSGGMRKLRNVFGIRERGRCASLLRLLGTLVGVSGRAYCSELIRRISL